MLLTRLTCLLLLLIASSASAVTMAWSPIGNPANACNPLGPPDGCVGTVSYNYSIGTYEVTNAQYVEFLNAKAQSDPLGLYNTNMSDPSHSTDFGYGGITRAGDSGSYTYQAIAGSENMPVNYVSFYDTLRFANWMSNGHGNGNTETGAYTLLGGTPVPSNATTVTRNAGASIVLPSENEWYKAAYYDGGTASYFGWPTGSNTQTTCSGTPTATANYANCQNLTGLKPVGSYTGSISPYGTFDQGGNVREWTEEFYSFSPGSRRARGGAFDSYVDDLSAGSSGGPYYVASGEGRTIGFRLVMIPEPNTGLLVIAGLLGLAGWRRASD
jgi:sulfatase modifying factor 1